MVGQSLKGMDVQRELNNVCQEEGCTPERIQCDNGSEFISKDVDRWAYESEVTLDFSRPGKPTDNPYVESFNGKFREAQSRSHKLWPTGVSFIKLSLSTYKKEVPTKMVSLNASTSHSEKKY